MKRILFAVVSITLPLAASAASAAQIPITASQTSINGVDSLTGANQSAPYAAEGGRVETKLVNGGILSGNPLVQSNGDVNTDYWDAYGPPGTSGSQGLLIDLGGVYSLAAIQLFGFNTTTDPSVQKRSLASFTLWTATDPAAVTISGGGLIVNGAGGLSLFSQVGGTQAMDSVVNAPTFGDSYLFGGKQKPSGLGGTSHVVTGAEVSARYLFLRNMTASVGADANIVGLGEVQVYTPEPSSLCMLIVGSPILCVLRRLRRQA